MSDTWAQPIALITSLILVHENCLINPSLPRFLAFYILLYFLLSFLDKLLLKNSGHALAKFGEIA